MSDPYYQQPPQEVTQEDTQGREQVEAAIKQAYADVDQPGLDPGNRPSQRMGLAEGERDPHKSTRDLEDITGNPGHVGVNPNEAQSMNPPPPVTGEMLSINEPPGSEVMPPADAQQPQDQGAYQQQQNTPYPYDPQQDQQQPYQPIPPY